MGNSETKKLIQSELERGGANPALLDAIDLQMAGIAFEDQQAQQPNHHSMAHHTSSSGHRRRHSLTGQGDLSNNVLRHSLPAPLSALNQQQQQRLFSSQEFPQPLSHASPKSPPPLSASQQQKRKLLLEDLDNLDVDLVLKTVARGCRERRQEGIRI